MEQEVLAARTEALGASHPDTLATQGNLAVTLKDPWQVRGGAADGARGPGCSD